MILAPATRALLVEIAHGRPVGLCLSGDAAQSLVMLGLATPGSGYGVGTLTITTQGRDLLPALVRCDDLPHLERARTAFGRVVGLVLRGPTTKITLERAGRLLDLELPSDCWIGVIP